MNPKEKDPRREILDKHAVDYQLIFNLFLDGKITAAHFKLDRDRNTDQALKKLSALKEIDENELGLIVFKGLSRCSGEEARERWTAKYITINKDLATEIAEALKANKKSWLK